MDITIHPRPLRGEITIIPSKSQAHRLLICAAFADKPTQIVCPDTNRDIDATVDCLNALGADIRRTDSGFLVVPVTSIPSIAQLNCCESGSTLRFMLPIVGALGVDATFLMEGRLPQRPLSPLWEEMERMGCSLFRPTENTLRCWGKLHTGLYSISGSISSQYITGLSFALCLMEPGSSLEITGKLESKPYLDLTNRAISLFGGGFGKGRFCSPGYVNVEGDWSNGAFFVTAAFLGSELTIRGLDKDSVQGDRAIVDILPRIKSGIFEISAADIPDLVPILSVAAAIHHGAVFTDIQRLRLKESDRVASTIAMIEALGGKAEATQDRLTIYGTGLTGGTVDSVNDHRIAMASAIAATVCHRDVTILGAQCVRKSYPRFWEEYQHFGGHYEQYIR